MTIEKPIKLEKLVTSPRTVKFAKRKILAIKNTHITNHKSSQKKQQKLNRLNTILIPFIEKKRCTHVRKSFRRTFYL